MNTQEGQYIYELVDATGKVVATDFPNRKALESCIKLLGQFKPDFHETHQIKRLKVVLDTVEKINA